jgi:hypothetical protein
MEESEYQKAVKVLYNKKSLLEQTEKALSFLLLKENAECFLSQHSLRLSLLVGLKKMKGPLMKLKELLGDCFREADLFFSFESVWNFFVDYELNEAVLFLSQNVDKIVVANGKCFYLLYPLFYFSKSCINYVIF